MPQLLGRVGGGQQQAKLSPQTSFVSLRFLPLKRVARDRGQFHTASLGKTQCSDMDTCPPLTFSPSCRQPATFTHQPSTTGSVATSISRLNTSEWGDLGSRGWGWGRGAEATNYSAFLLKPLPHHAPTQLPQSGAPGAISVRQVRHQV